uniref:Uncharacterized protein n=1 Tax=Romanomermis culicivorax TaxID=13658 RepID=A0A915KAU2_ROMCU
MDYATVATTLGRTVAWTPAAKRPLLDAEALKTACGHCWYHPNKYTANCQSLECHSLELFVGQGIRGQANHSFAFIKYRVPSTRQSSFVPEGAPCLTSGRKKVGVCSGRACLDIDNPTEVAQFEKLDTNPIDGQWTSFGAFNQETKSCLTSNAYYTLASQCKPVLRVMTTYTILINVLTPKYADMKCSSGPKCFPFIVVFRSCTKQKPSNRGKHCFETETSKNWLRISARTSPLIVFACKSCKRDRWPSDKPLDFRPDCEYRYGDEYSCPSAAGDWTTMTKNVVGFAVSDFEYCCNGNELGRCILGTCMPFYDG